MNLPKIIILAVFFTTGLVFSVTVSAIGVPGGITPPAGQVPDNRGLLTPPEQASPPALPAGAMARFGDPNQAKEKLASACQAKEGVIKTRSSNLERMAGNMESKFDAISLRVQDYYTQKVLPNGKKVIGYETYLADIQNNKDQVQALLTQTKDGAAGFNCTLVDPKTPVIKFREDMRETKQALKAYRTSIKNLILAINSASGFKVEGNNK
ncbi:hypothetical protein A3E45_02305 [Candidatus Daviesbacteria bacterium RIFCSPHIGHO2_12_FULL_43_11]|uniref:Uncharacterized protein n=2 Tax=Candidatus Daviesiibacteriota TaxID=1752718 RepID=A0A1F5K5P6_9BACT|nr:MAG: hypothetical protein UV41_C0040G0007 [Candidatus Daviesbacteria bacterium GW2011_GWA2_42_7]OGE18935.1 MAG: hypothetical protein A2874_03825 [Candidatus Daviesbacteria bacterium RIFCSPHIGHO2_01_FULL_43_17]OGE36118.1 MAG: hypothetical protein A3E45_02305 [Candidatus Daviesbacteria bacterium RIFCSPHIGHO2_12_FULL_43_11]